MVPSTSRWLVLWPVGWHTWAWYSWGLWMCMRGCVCLWVCAYVGACVHMCEIGSCCKCACWNFLGLHWGTKGMFWESGNSQGKGFSCNLKNLSGPSLGDNCPSDRGRLWKPLVWKNSFIYLSAFPTFSITDTLWKLSAGRCVLGAKANHPYGRRVCGKYSFFRWFRWVLTGGRGMN